MMTEKMTRTKMFYIVSKTIVGSVLWCLLVSVNAFAQIDLPEPSKPAAPQTGYRIKQGDKLSVKFLYHPELNEISVVVRPDGFISLQMIDDSKAEGLTISELKAQLEKSYNEILLKPVLTVALLEFVAPRVFIGGQVNKPGRYELREGQTLVQVIFLAGGFTSDANRKMVIHARPNGSGDWEIQSANVLKVINQQGEQKDIALQDGDYIFIPDSKISQINKAVETVRGFLPRFF
ncbi:MAG TPA: polysaccharide biosynthesis/export family protein [Pyrinomonadaceae bacterium]|jgi:protein involved in polysaccharide export with SLBB domain